MTVVCCRHNTLHAVKVVLVITVVVKIDRMEWNKEMEDTFIEVAKAEDEVPVIIFTPYEVYSGECLDVLQEREPVDEVKFIIQDYVWRFVDDRIPEEVTIGELMRKLQSHFEAWVGDEEKEITSVMEFRKSYEENARLEARFVKRDDFKKKKNITDIFQGKDVFVEETGFTMEVSHFSYLNGCKRRGVAHFLTSAHSICNR